MVKTRKKLRSRGTRRDVMDGLALQTSGGLRIGDLKQDYPGGPIKSRRASEIRKVINRKIARENPPTHEGRPAGFLSYTKDPEYILRKGETPTDRKNKRESLSPRRSL
jgi:hypothetical protein